MTRDKYSLFKVMQIKNEMSESKLSVIDKKELEMFNFDIKRCYYVTDLNKYEIRGDHGHKLLNQIIFSTSGRILVYLKKIGSEEITDEVELVNNGLALYIPGGFWRKVKALENNSSFVVLADRWYNEDDYVR